LKQAILYDKLPDGKVRCNICQRRCCISEGKIGFCRTRINREGTLYSLAYGRVSSLHRANIENKPLFHFHPGSHVMSFGTLGCNFLCPGCQNWDIAHAAFDEDRRSTQYISPSKSVELAKEFNCQGMSWTYNEPTVWFEWTLEGAKIAKKSGLYTTYVTNGYITPEALDLIGPYLDAFRVDIKAFSSEAYSKIANVRDFSGILEVTMRAKQKWGMWVECVTNIIPGYSDDEETLKNIAAWIAGDLGKETPWHVTRFVPHLDLSHLQSTPVKTIEKARKIGFEAGLRYVYTGNIFGHPGENTYCYKCKELLINRNISGHIKNSLAPGARCHKCGTGIDGRFE